MSTIEIMKNLLAQDFENIEDFKKELNSLCEIVEIEIECEKERRYQADYLLNCLPYCTCHENRCKFYLENKELKAKLEKI